MLRFARLCVEWAMCVQRTVLRCLLCYAIHVRVVGPVVVNHFVQFGVNVVTGKLAETPWLVHALSSTGREREREGLWR